MSVAMSLPMSLQMAPRPPPNLVDPVCVPMYVCMYVSLSLSPSLSVRWRSRVVPRFDSTALMTQLEISHKEKLVVDFTRDTLHLFHFFFKSTKVHLPPPNSMRLAGSNE